MSARKSIATVVILAAGLFTGEVRADCLDGHVENFGVEVQLGASRPWPIADLPQCSETKDTTSISDELECPNRDRDANGQWFSVPGPKVAYSLSTSPTGYTLTVHAEVNPTLGLPQGASMSAASVSFQRVGGDVDCTWATVSKFVNEGVVTVTTGGLFRCGATGRTVPGAVTCTQTVSCTPTVSSATRYWLAQPAGPTKMGPSG